MGRIDAVNVVGLDVLVVSVMLVEPKAVVVDVSLNALRSLLPLGIGLMNLNVSWLVGVVAFVPIAPPGVEEDVPNPEKPVTPCEGPLSADVVAVPKTEPVVVEDEGRTAALEIPLAVVSDVGIFQSEGFLPNSPSVSKEDKKSAISNECVGEVNLKVSLFEETAFMPKGLLAEGALELFILGLPSFISKKPFADGALDVVLLEAPSPEKPVVLGDVPLDASLFAVVPKEMPVELAFEV